VLTDGDLKALVDWTAARSSLQRYRDGWGVACGLEVSCTNEKPSRVVVAPGYGVDCCGRDVVVCEPISYDFQCEKPFDPCCPDRVRDPRPNQLADAIVDQQQLGCIPMKELRAFDLCLRFAETHTAGQRPLARGNCRTLEECQSTRVIEGGVLYANEVANPCNVVPTEKQYRADLSLHLKEIAACQSDPAKLLKLVSGKLHTFCFVEECLCEFSKPRPGAIRNQVEEQKSPTRAALAKLEAQYAAVTAEQIPELIFYIVQDWRNHYFQCLCAPCKGGSCDGDGIPLARVLVRNKMEGDCKVCKVVQVDSYPPFRRPLSRDCGPCPPGLMDLSRYIWRDSDSVQKELRRSGITIEKIELFEAPKTLEFFTADQNDYICAANISKISMKTYKDLCDRERVVAFGGAS
jgi:hypothetical protein